MSEMEYKYVTLKQAAKWAKNYLNKSVTSSNIQYLVQYAKIKRYKEESGSTKVDINELKNYYDKFIQDKELIWKEKLGKDLDWNLSFSNLRESETTKHVHRLHPYKGKFIPQLVEYFLDEHKNSFKKQPFFRKGDTIIDPFAGSGTTLVQAQELGLNSIGIDISEFNCLISKAKIDNYNIDLLERTLLNAFEKTKTFSQNNFDGAFDLEMKSVLSEFNEKHFPSVEFKHRVYEKQINEQEYSKEKLSYLLTSKKKLFNKGNTQKDVELLSEKEMAPFLKKWFSSRIKQELFFYIKQIDSIKEEKIRNLMRIIISRTARSCRATTHSDLATLKEPQTNPYYCHKHFKICTPVDNILKHLKKNTNDTIKRINEFSKLKKMPHAAVIDGDSREIDVFEEVKKQNQEFFKLLKKKKIDGLFTSPPYVGYIDYHEQHAYAYELFGIKRKDEKEIGPLFSGKGIKAKESYVEGISQVFLNINKFLKEDADIFVVANDTFNLYPEIAKKSNFKIVNQFKRPVLNRTERAKQPYAEIIFHMKKN